MRNRIHVRGLAIAGALVLGAPATTPLIAQSGTLVVSGRSSVFYAGLATPPAGDGEVPPTFAFAADAGRVLTFTSVTGLTDCCGQLPGTGPEGVLFGQPIAPLGGISGYTGPRAHALLGVFLAGGTPGGAPPATLDFNAIGTEFLTLSPQIGQVFFIGNGRTAGGVAQLFNVPVGATNLYLGLPDTCGLSGPPGCYTDNAGSLTAQFTIAPGLTTVPEPGSILLLTTGLLAVSATARRNARRVR